MKILKSIYSAVSIGAAGLLGAASLTAAASAQSLIRDTEIEHMMRDFTDPLLVAAELEPNDVSLYLIADPQINAFVTGGQNIFMHTGTIVQADNPLQLKGVIAHEAGHIAGAHLARFGDGAEAATNTMLVTVGLGLLAALAGEGQAAGALMASSQQFGTLNFLTYSRAQEAAADQAALRYLEATGQSSEGLMEFFERFRAQEVMSSARRFPYFRSHPMSSDRVQSMRDRVRESPYYGVEDDPEDLDMLRRAQAKIYGFTMEPAFVFYRYPESDQSLYARYARSVAYYRQGELDEAREEIESLIAEEPENPYFHELYGQMLFETGRTEESIPHHQRSVELEPTAPLLRINLGQALIALGDPQRLDEAESHLKIAVDIEPRNPFAWYNLAALYGMRDEVGLAQLATAEQNFSVGNPMRAYRFASMALPKLEQGSREWGRATEIISWSQVAVEDMQRRR